MKIPLYVLRGPTHFCPRGHKESHMTEQLKENSNNNKMFLTRKGALLCCISFISKFRPMNPTLKSLDRLSLPRRHSSSTQNSISDHHSSPEWGYCWAVLSRALWSSRLKASNSIPFLSDYLFQTEQEPQPKMICKNHALGPHELGANSKQGGKS